ncbi:MAG: hypothetical protein J6W46_10015 [Spirochaetaceae bacterium]|nr:hypothetical protein [Spirochaetaceae bacterium]
MAKKITQAQMLEAIKGSQGLVTKIQRKLESMLEESVCWDTVEKYVHKWESCEQAVKAEKEAMLDLAENNVFKELVSGDIATSKWYLRMKGKDRGYIETQEIHNVNVDPLNINLQGELFTAEELANCSGVEISGEESTQGE